MSASSISTAPHLRDKLVNFLFGMPRRPAAWPRLCAVAGVAAIAAPDADV